MTVPLPDHGDATKATDPVGSPSSTGITLTDLPIEVILDILEPFMTRAPESGYPHEYRSLAQVCRQLRIQLAPAMYRDIRLSRLSLSAGLAGVMYLTTEMSQHFRVRSLHMAFGQEEKLSLGPPVLGATNLTHHLQELSITSTSPAAEHPVITTMIISGLDAHAPTFPHLTTLALEKISFTDFVQLSLHCPRLRRLTVAFSDYNFDNHRADLMSLPKLEYLRSYFHDTIGYIGLGKVLASSPKLTELHLSDRMRLRGKYLQIAPISPVKHLRLQFSMFTSRPVLLDDTLMGLGLASLETLVVEDVDSYHSAKDFVVMPEVSDFSLSWHECLTPQTQVRYEDRLANLKSVLLRWLPCELSLGTLTWMSGLRFFANQYTGKVLRNLPSLERVWNMDQVHDIPQPGEKVETRGGVCSITEYGQAENTGLIRVRWLFQEHQSSSRKLQARLQVLESQGWLTDQKGDQRHIWRDYWYLKDWPLPCSIAGKFAIALRIEKETGWVEGNRKLELTDAARKLIQKSEPKDRARGLSFVRTSE